MTDETTQEKARRLAAYHGRKHPLPVPRWDEEQFEGETLDVFPDLRGSSTQATASPVDPSFKQKLSGLWLCQVCRNAPALVPSERTWKFRVLGLQGSLVFRSPISCYTCRLFRQEQVRILGRADYRPFWKNIIALWEGDSPPSAPMWFRRLMYWRRKLGG